MARSVSQSSRRIDRAQGCLVGLAIGDALGATVEFLDPEEIRSQFGVHRELSGEGWLRLQPGEVTDDTQMARILAESLLESTKFDAEDLGKKLVNWLESKPRDVEIADREGIERIAAGVPPLEAGMSGELGSGNGSVVRGISLGIRYYKERKILREFSFAQSSLTHLQEEAQWGSYLCNSLVAWFLEGYSPEEARRLAKAEFKESPPSLFKALKEPIDLARPSSYVGDTLNAVFHDLFKNESFEEILVAVVNRGGDSDSAGAIAGALAGAHYGLTKIPARWVEAVQYGKEMAKLGAELCKAADMNRRKR